MLLRELELGDLDLMPSRPRKGVRLGLGLIVVGSGLSAVLFLLGLRAGLNGLFLFP